MWNHYHRMSCPSLEDNHALRQMLRQPVSLSICFPLTTYVCHKDISPNTFVGIGLGLGYG